VTATSLPPRVAPTTPSRGSTAQAFLRTLRAEWLRLRTVKATWWFLAAAALIMIGIATAAGASAADQPDPPSGDPAWTIAEIVILPAQFALLSLAAMAVTADYATGGIVPALQWTPRRSVLFLARTLVAAGTATVAGVLIAAAAGLAGWAAARPLLTLPPEDAVDPLGTVALVLAGGTLLAVGLSFLLRSTAGVLVSVFLLMLVLPGLLPQLGYDWLTDLSDRLPGTAAIFLLTEEPRGRGLDDTAAVLTLLAWAASALLLGWLRLVRDDVDR
jgi:ABC-2 type transport system permease protein